MEHLTVDEIIEFVSLTKMDSKAIELSATVNGHIRKCEKCLEQVRAFQKIHDEFTGKDFQEYAFREVKEEKKDSPGEFHTI